MFHFSKAKLIHSLVILTVASIGVVFFLNRNTTPEIKGLRTDVQNYWFLLHRKSNKEELFFGVPGVKEKSKLVKTFKVKTGRPGERPTPLPELVGREYWIITAKEPAFDNAETAPYFITLDVPAPEEPPYGPVPYLECDGQCDWDTYGAFGLHGVNQKYYGRYSGLPDASGSKKNKCYIFLNSNFKFWN